MKEFKVNEYITLKLEDGLTNIYIKGDDYPFLQCKYLLMRKTINELEDFIESIESIDELAEHLDHSFETIEPELIDIPAETRFWAHCSNMQVWAENNYETKLLHSNLAFPLLKRLMEIGDPIAKKIFKEEIAERYKKGNYNLKRFLVDEGYISYLTMDEILNGILDSEDSNIMIEILNSNTVEYELAVCFDDDEIRRRYYDKYYFSIKDGNINELDVEITRNNEHIIDLIYKLKNLRKLNIFIKDYIILREIKSTSLYHLNIYFEKGGKIIDSFENLPNLFYLQIQGRGETSFENIPESIGYLKNLEKLIISNVNLKEIPKSLMKLKKLKWLEIRNANLKTLQNEIANIKSLRVLDLIGNPNLKIPKEITESKDLEILNIDEYLQKNYNTPQ